MKRNKIIMIGGVLGLFLIAVGITYAYFSANIFNNENTSTINYEAGSLAIELDGGNNIVANAIIPGDSPWATKTFTVIGNNDSNGYMPYSVSLVVDENTYSDDAISYTLEGSNTSNNGSIIENRENTEVNYTDIIGSAYFTPGKNLKHTYTLKLYFLETNTDQSEDMRSTFKAHIEINGGRASKNKITVTFDADGGELNTLSKEVVGGGAYGNLPIPTKEGYEFLGWNGKNLFNLEVPKSVPSSNAWTNSAIRTFEPETYIIGISGNNYFYPTNAELIAMTNRHINFISKNSGYGIGFPKLLENGKTYVISCKKSNIDVGFYTSDGTFLSNASGTFIVPDNAYYSNIVVYNFPLNTQIVASDIQLEEGAEATEYEPYYIDKYTKVVQYEDHTLKAIWKEIE